MRRFALAVLTILCCAGLAPAQSGTLNLYTSDADTLRPLAAAKGDLRLFANGATDTVAVALVPIDLNPSQLRLRRLPLRFRRSGITRAIDFNWVWVTATSAS